MELILETIVNAIVQSGFYALIAVGLVLIFGVLGIINFAHGEFYMAGAYTVWYLYSVLSWPFPIAVIGAFLLVMAIGLIMERLLFRPMRDNPLGGLIMSIGALFILQVLAVKIGGVGLMKHVPSAYEGTLQVFPDVFVSYMKLVALGIAVSLLAVIWYFLTNTRLGWALRAVAQDHEAAALQGISIDRISMLAVGLGAGLAGIAGGLIAPMARVEPYMGHHAIITAFIVTIVGGLGSLGGAVLAAILYAFFNSFVTTYYGGTVSTMLGLLLMLVVLIIKPTGIMGARISE